MPGINCEDHLLFPLPRSESNLGRKTEAFSNWEREVCMVTLSPGIVSKLSMGECVRELTGLESEISRLGSNESHCAQC